MTENEAIEELKYDCNELGKAIPCDTSWGKSFENAYAMAIKALKEVQQYCAIGTPEECRAAMEKQTAKKPKEYEDKYYACPVCGNPLLPKWEKYPDKLMDKSNGLLYCLGCGQKLDWSEVE